MIKVEEIKEIYNFEPKYTFSQLEQNLPRGFEEKIQDGRLYKAVSIKNKKSKKDFSHWLDTEAHCGGHPFEIVFSWFGHGIHLFPPDLNNPYFTLRVTNYMYALAFLEMVKEFIKNRIPFKAHKLEGVLDYLSGESCFTVNAYDEHYIFYSYEDRKLLRHIEWDEPNILIWK
jgi:hypothetical protein